MKTQNRRALSRLNITRGLIAISLTALLLSFLVPSSSVEMTDVKFDKLSLEEKRDWILKNVSLSVSALAQAKPGALVITDTFDPFIFDKLAPSGIYGHMPCRDRVPGFIIPPDQYKNLGIVTAIDPQETTFKDVIKSIPDCNKKAPEG